MKKLLLVDEAVYVFDLLIIRLEEIKDDMKTISTRSTWLLGIIVVIVLALLNFIINDFNSDANVNNFASVVWITAIVLCINYSVIVLIYVPLLIMPNFGNPIYEEYTQEQLQECKKQNIRNLNKLKKHFRTLVGLFIFLPTASLSFIGAWYLVA